MTKEKGIEDAVRAVCEINSMHSDIFAELDIYGQIEDNQEEWLKKLQTLAPGYIKYKGMVPFSQSTKVLKEYDALLFPTYYEGEGFAGTIIDAFAAGLPVIASDWKYNSEIIKSGMTGVIFKTHSYVVDVVSGIFKVLFNGLNGEVYNIANENSIASIAEVASICAEIAGTNVVFDLPDKIEKKGFSQSKDCILDNSKLKSLGWNGKYTLKQGLVETIESLREDE